MRIRIGLAAILTLLTGCAGEVGPPPNQPPEARGSIPDQTVHASETKSLDVSGYFTDPDGDELEYTASSSDSTVAMVRASASRLTVTGETPGVATVTVAAEDPFGLTVNDTFTVTVVRTDRTVLVALYESMNGDGWLLKDGWLSNRPIGDWFGVEANGDGRVTSLKLHRNRLTGEIPPELGELDKATHVWLFQNDIGGEIPPELGELKSVGQLVLHQNNLTGSIPPEIGGLPSLWHFEVGDNRLTGQVPPELGNAGSLQILRLNDNALTGEIPTELGNLGELEHLDLSENKLTGSVPEELGGTSLIDLHLNGNSLADPIPDSFLDLTVYVFYWGDNDGLCLPDTDEFGDWLEVMEEYDGPICDG